jgi:hypothetical protein
MARFSCAVCNKEIKEGEAMTAPLFYDVDARFHTDCFENKIRADHKPLIDAMSRDNPMLRMLKRKDAKV